MFETFSSNTKKDIVNNSTKGSHKYPFNDFSFVNNTACRDGEAGRGGAIYFDAIGANTPTFYNCTMYNNSADFGGAVYFGAYPAHNQVSS